MARYIDAEKIALEIISRVNRACDGDYYRGLADERSSIFQLIAGAPSEDVSPNLYGEWTTQGGGDYYCSNCYYEIEERKRTEYCPSCGANMQMK